MQRSLKLPRRSRTIEIVINVPELPAPNDAPQTAVRPKLRGWARVWAIAKVAGPVGASIAAIAISLAALLSQNSANSEQRKVDQAAATLNRTQQAALVSFIEDPSGEGFFHTITIENTSASSINGVLFEVQGSKLSSHQSLTVWISLGTVPSCSQGNVNVESEFERAINTPLTANSRRVQAIPVSAILYFQDHNGIYWIESGYGPPRRGDPVLPKQLRMAFAYPKYQKARGCT